MAMYEINFTAANGTQTSEGFIPHHKHDGLDCPVMVTVDTKKPAAFPTPQRQRKALLFALPGGGCVAA
jgi:hypothetical protein